MVTRPGQGCGWGGVKAFSEAIKIAAPSITGDPRGAATSALCVDGLAGWLAGWLVRWGRRGREGGGQSHGRFVILRFVIFLLLGDVECGGGR